MDTPGITTSWILFLKFPTGTATTVILFAEAAVANITGSWDSAAHRAIRDSMLPTVSRHVKLNRMDPLMWEDGLVNYETRSKNRKALLLKAGQEAWYNVIYSASRVNKAGKNVPDSFAFKVGQYNFNMASPTGRDLVLPRRSGCLSVSKSRMPSTQRHTIPLPRMESFALIVLKALSVCSAPFSVITQCSISSRLWRC